MAGLYFHIPFCRRICAYCDFFRSAELKWLPAAVQAMHTETDEQRDFLCDSNIRTIYFGGGTPSLVEPSQVQLLIDHAARLWEGSQGGEITLEANPDDIPPEYVAALRSTDVNRVSLGVQSFDDEELRFMNRRHSAADAVAAVRRLQDAGIENITIDLIFGVDGFGEQVLDRSLAQALELDVQHVSAYHLTIEQHTAFHRRLTEAGYEHYEVSNFAREGYRAQHNSSYWHGEEYLGIGTGAHSFNGRVRRWSQQPVAEYIAERRYEEEFLSEQDHRNERVKTALRCAEGIDLEAFESRFGAVAKEQILQAAKPWIAQGDVVVSERRMRIPTERFLISDAVIESLFEV